MNGRPQFNNRSRGARLQLAVLAALDVHHKNFLVPSAALVAGAAAGDCERDAARRPVSAFEFVREPSSPSDPDFPAIRE